MKILLCIVDLGNKLSVAKLFDSLSKKLELMKQFHLFKKGFVIFLKGATFSDFIDTRLLNYIPSGIQNRFPLFWRIYFQFGSNLIKKWGGRLLIQTESVYYDLLDNTQRFADAVQKGL